MDPAFPKEPLMTTALLPIRGAPVVSSRFCAPSVAGLLPFLLKPVHFLRPLRWPGCWLESSRGGIGVGQPLLPKSAGRVAGRPGDLAPPHQAEGERQAEGVDSAGRRVDVVRMRSPWRSQLIQHNPVANATVSAMSTPATTPRRVGLSWLGSRRSAPDSHASHSTP